MSVYCHGGYHQHDIDDLVEWHGRVGRVIGLTVQPSVIIEFPDGERATVGQGVVEPHGQAEVDCPTCGADVDHGEPHYGDCKPSDSGSDRG
jgi:hypothetical protein